MKVLRQPPPRPSRSVTAALVAEAEKRVKRLQRHAVSPREIPRDLWPKALSVIERAELSAMETAMLPLRQRVRKMAPSLRDMLIRPAAGWSAKRRRLPVGVLGVVLQGLPSPQVPTLMAAALSARQMGVDRIVATAPDEPQGGVSALVLAIAEMTQMDRFAAIRPEEALVGLSLGLWGLPRCDRVLSVWSPMQEALCVVLAGLSPTKILLLGHRDLLVVAEGEADPHQIALELASHGERSPDGRRGVLSPSGTLLKALRKAIKGLPENASGQSYVMQTESMADALDLADSLGPDILWLLAAQPDTWLARQESAAAVLVGPNSPPSLAELAIPPATAAGNGAFGALSPGHLVRERLVEELTSERHSKLALAAARIAESEFRPLSAKAAAWVRQRSRS